MKNAASNLPSLCFFPSCRLYQCRRNQCTARPNLQSDRRELSEPSEIEREAAIKAMPVENIGNVSAREFARLLSGPLLDVFVGPEDRQWSLHQTLLCYHSQFFDEDYVINGDHKRIKDGKLELPNEDPEAFEMLVQWLYQGQIRDVSWMPKDVKWDYAYTCQKLYLMSSLMGLNELRNVAIDQFRKGCNEARLVPGPEEMCPIYMNTPKNSPFRKLISRIAARQLMDPDVKRDANTYRACFEASPDFAIDVINEIREGTGGVLFDDPTEGNSCRYHEHTSGETCHKTVKFENGVKEPDWSGISANNSPDSPESEAWKTPS